MAKEVKRNAGSKSFKLFSRLFTQTGNLDEASAQKTAEQETKSGLPQFKLVFFIVDWNQIRTVSGVFEAGNVAFHFINKGKGTASSEILDLLGIGANDKAVIICLCHPESVHSLMKEVRKKLNFRTPGAGIAFAVPLSAINNPVLRMMTKLSSEKQNAGADVLPAQENAAQSRDSKGQSPGGDRRSGRDRRSGHDRRDFPDTLLSERGKAPGEFTHDLIIAAVNQGYSDELMNAAREAGAFGGTVLYGRGQTGEGAVKFLGISVQDEREIILILSTKEKKEPIMEAVRKNRSPNSKAQGMVFSLPVENVMGLSYE